MPTPRIPARHAEIFWNDDPARPGRAGGAEVLVMDRRRRDRVTGDPKHLLCSAGAMASGWIKDGHALDQPAGVFATYWLTRDASPDAIRAALVQFGQIEECGWAREMLAAFDHVDGLE